MHRIRDRRSVGRGMLSGMGVQRFVSNQQSNNEDDHQSSTTSSSSSSNRSIYDNEDETDYSSEGDDMSDLDLPPGFYEFLSAQQNNVDDKLTTIANQLRGKQTVFAIRLVRKFVYDSGATLIASAIEDGYNSCSNHRLNDDNNTAISMSTRCVSISTPCRCPTSQLREIILSRCHIGDDGTCSLAHAISNTCLFLKTLDLSSNDITGVGVTCLANCVVTAQREGERSSRIDTLVLSSNSISSDGVAALANALKGEYSKYPINEEESTEEDAPSIQKSVGFCSLKQLHLSGCQLNDEDAMVLGNALLPHCPQSEPALSTTDGLVLLNLHRNRITINGMEFLYSVIHNWSSPQNETDGDSNLHPTQSLYCQSNHTIELGVIVDYGTRDHNYGNFFDQAEDEQLLLNMRNYEMTGTVPSTANVDEMKQLMVKKIILKEKMMNALEINRQCAMVLQNFSKTSNDAKSLETLQQTPQEILCTAARSKITHALEEKLQPSTVTLPRRQDEHGKFLDNEKDILDVNNLKPKCSTVGEQFSSLDLNVFPQLLGFINRHIQPPKALAMVFDILRESPDVCSFHSLSIGKRPKRM